MRLHRHKPSQYHGDEFWIDRESVTAITSMRLKDEPPFCRIYMGERYWDVTETYQELVEAMDGKGIDSKAAYVLGKAIQLLTEVAPDHPMTKRISNFYMYDHREFDEELGFK